MEIYIYGAGNVGTYVLEILKGYYPFLMKNFCGFIDKNKKTPVNGIPIVPLESVKPESRIVIAIQSRDTAIDVH